jgi:hypothetical protein
MEPFIFAYVAIGIVTSIVVTAMDQRSDGFDPAAALLWPLVWLMCAFLAVSDWRRINKKDRPHD